MSVYQDERIQLDDEHLVIKTMRGERTVAVGDIEDVRRFTMSKFGSRWRVVGLGFERPRTWFNWDNSRRSKTEGLELDVGQFFKIGVTPDDCDKLAAALDAHPERRKTGSSDEDS